MRFLVAISAIVVVLLSAGCADRPPMTAPSFSPAPPAPSGMATLYIYRPRTSQNGMAVWPIMSLNGTKVAEVKMYSYTYVYLKPGNYKITSERSQLLTGLNNVPGEFTISTTGDYYLAFVSGGGSYLAPIGGNLMPLPGPTSYGWLMLSKAQAMNFDLPVTRYLPAINQIISD